MKSILPDRSAFGAGTCLVGFKQRQPRRDLLPCLVLVFWYKGQCFVVPSPAMAFGMGRCG